MIGVLFQRVSLRTHVWGCGLGKMVNKSWLTLSTKNSSLQKFYWTKSPKATMLMRKLNHPVCIPCRHLQKIRNKPIPRNEKDNIPNSFTLIYQNSTETYVKLAGAIMAVFGTFTGVFMYVYMNGKLSWEEGRNGVNKASQLLIIDKEIPLPAKMCGFFLFSAIFIGSFRIYRTAVYRIYRNFDTEQYIAVVPKISFKDNTLIFTRYISFLKADMKIYPLTHFRWIRGDLVVKGKAMIVDRHDFAVPKFFHDIFGDDYESGAHSEDISAQDLQKSLQSGFSSRKKK